MNIYKQTKTGNSQLLLIFSGWAASPEVFLAAGNGTGYGSLDLL